MKYVSEKYQKQLDDLAETLCRPERFEQEVGQLALFGASNEVVNPYDDFAEGLPLGFDDGLDGRGQE